MPISSLQRTQTSHFRGGSALAAFLIAGLCQAQCGPLVLGHMGGKPAVISARGNYQYLGLPGELQVRDVTNPAAPIVLSSVELPGMPSEIEPAGNFLYVACGDQGLRVIDVTNPSAPVIASDFAGAGTVDVAVSNNKAFVVRRDEVTILDASVPTALTVLGHFTNPSAAREVESRNNIAFVGTSDSVLVVDASTPATPVIIDQRLNVLDIGDMDLRNDLLVVASGDTVRLFDITVPASMSQVASRQADSANELSQLAQSGGTMLLYYLGAQGNLRCDDVTVPSSPVGLTTIDTGHDAVKPLGSLLFTADSANLQTHDMTVPTSPAMIWSGEHTLARVSSIATISGALIVANDSAMEIYDTSTPSQLSLLSSTPMGVVSSRLVVEGTTAYWCAIDGADTVVRIYSVANPLAPVAIGSFVVPMFVNQIDVENQFVYLVGVTGLKIYDATNPAHVVLRSTTPCGVENLNVVVENGAAYTTDRFMSMRAFDVHNPLNPVQVATYATRPATFLRGTEARDQLLFVAQSDGRVDIYDASNPGAIVPRGFVVDVGLSGICLVDTLLTTQKIDGTVSFFDTSTPSSPALLYTRTLAGYVGLAADRGSSIYLAGSSLGVYTMRAPGFPRIDEQPQSTGGCNGSTVHFDVSLGNPAGATYQWFRGATPLANGLNIAGTNVSGATSNQLTLSALHAFDLGAYSCVASNACGSAASDVANLIAGSAPAITGQPADQAVCPSGAAEFTVAWSGTQPATYQWQAEVPANSGNFLPMANLVNSRFSIGGVTSRTLSIAANPLQTLPLNLATRVRCVVTNNCSSATSQAASFSICAADFNCDASVDLFDYLDFILLFATGNAEADFNDDAVVDLFDYLDFVQLFSGGC